MKNDANSPDSDRQRLLEEQYAELATLAGGLVHEIKNPLSTLNLNLQLLAEDFQQAQSQKERRALLKIETLQRECQRLEDILSDFLRYARVCDLDFKVVALNDVVEEMIEFHHPQAQAAGVLIRSYLATPSPRVRMDVNFFKQALLNLFLNALAAMPTGGELIMKAREEGERVLLDVIDTGHGIDAEAMTKIFRPFFSTRRSGSGLGLPTTKRIIEAHGGTLEVRSEPGKGTAFTIVLPSVREH